MSYGPPSKDIWDDLGVRENSPEQNSDFSDLLNAKFSRSHNNLPSELWRRNGGSWLELEFMMHDQGCWAILSNRHSGEETGRINLGTYKTIEQIEALVSALKASV